MNTILTMQIGAQQDCRFGLITREVVRLSENDFEIHDTSNGWTSAIVDFATMTELLEGDRSLLDIQFV